MAKKIDFNSSVYELTKQYPELIEILSSIGFTEIRKKFIRESVGKLMTIPKGAKMKGISMDLITDTLISNGFELDRIALLKSYLHRLSQGEDLESVRADFVDNFKNVEAAEIMHAEQELMAEGEPLKNVQRLCDVHSALFHGATMEEKILHAEKEVEASIKREQEKTIAMADTNTGKCASLIAIEGHPLQTFTRENKALKKLIEKARKQLGRQEDPTDTLKRIRQVAIHYAKKGDLLYPHLKVKYGITGPSEVMWTVDDEIRDEFASLLKSTEQNDEWKERVRAVLQRSNEMIYKEDNILFPICAANFTDEEWEQIYRDAKDYAPCLGVESVMWEQAEKRQIVLPDHQGEVVMPGGHLTVEQLTALLNTIPLEISFVDDGNINRYFNEGPKVFKRPAMAVDREVFTCHPPKIEPMVRTIIKEFREDKRNQVPIWMEKNGRTMLVTYTAVRDKEGHYVGTAEFVQDMEFAKEHFMHSTNKNK